MREYVWRTSRFGDGLGDDIAAVSRIGMSRVGAASIVPIAEIPAIGSIGIRAIGVVSETDLSLIIDVGIIPALCDGRAGDDIDVLTQGIIAAP